MFKELFKKQEIFKAEKFEEKIGRYEGNYTLVFQERMHNQIIRQRLIDNFYEHLSTLGVDAFEYANNYRRSPSQAERARKEFLKKLTKEKIAEEIDKNIGYVFSQTEIDYEKDPSQPADSDGLGSHGTVYLLSVDDDGNSFSPDQRSMFESHEKGHGIRMFYKESDFTKRLRGALDFSKISEETVNEYVNFVNKMRKGKAPKDAPEAIKYFESPHEIFERMSQLKNYFGMKGDEVFTQKHLEYARKHYVQHMGMRVQIQPFLEAITPEKEKEFIYLMNTLGV